jgi:hypothetical protein
MLPARRSLVFSVRPHTTNVGNDLIALGTELLVEAAWDQPADVVSLPSAGAGRGSKSAGLNARNLYEINLLADALLVGGGNIFENGALDVDPTALDALQVPMALLAVSSGRVRGRDGALHLRTDAVARDRIVRLCNRADPLLVRDDATAELLAGLGIEGATVAGCPSLLLGRLAHDLPKPDPDLADVALLSLRHPQLMSVPYAEQGRVRRDVASLIGRLGAEHDRVVLVCHDYRDLSFAAEFEGVEARYTEDPRRLMGWLRDCAVAVGYRLHGFLACVALGVPALHISYDERGETMIDTLGLRDYDVPLHESSDVADAVMERLAGLGGRPPGVVAEPALERLTDALVGGVQTLARRAAQRRVDQMPAR